MEVDVLSNELQIGKAGEHLVVFDLIMQGHNAFLADQGLPFDVVVIGRDGGLRRVQVKSTTIYAARGKNLAPHYRYSLRCAKKGARVVSAQHVDILAFVALDRKLVGYMPIQEMTREETGTIKQCLDLYSRMEPPTGRFYPNGTQRKVDWGRFIEDYAQFPG